jgi:superfamily II DNA helicase RecQ
MEADGQQLVDLDESSDEDEYRHTAQSGHALTVLGKRPCNAGSKIQSDYGDIFQPSKRIRLEKSHEGGEADVSLGDTELPPHISPTTPSFVEDEDLLLSDQDEDESRVLASLEQEEEDIMFDDDVMLDSDSVVGRDAVVNNVDDKLQLHNADVDKGDMHQHLLPEDVHLWTQKARAAFKQLFKDPAAKEKSPEQLNAIVMVMSARSDAMVTLRTGGGKSALWMIVPIICPDRRCIVICPFVALLEEQVERCLSAGLRAHNFTKDKNVPEDVQILFIQVESCSSKAFMEWVFMSKHSPLSHTCFLYRLMHIHEKRFQHIFIDENHDFLVCHPERKVPWRRLAHHLSKLRIPLSFLSGTNPPSNTATFLKHFSLETNDVIQVRSCTDRPEIGFHVLNVLPQAFDSSLQHIVLALKSTMSKSDRMLVFFSKNKEADAFGIAMDCAVFHSELPTVGNTKAANLERWDRGKTQIMACTTAFAQGMDRSSVRYVVISEVEYGLLVVNQMSGRAGRDGKESHTFYLTRKTTLSAFESDDDYDCSKGLDDVLFLHTCRRYTSIKYMDGEQFAYRCRDRPYVIQCDVCDPQSHMQLFSAKAIKDSSKSAVESEGNVFDSSSSHHILQHQ